MLAGFGLVFRTGTNRLHTLLEPTLDARVYHMHVFSADALAVSLAQALDNIAEFHALGTKVQRAGLELQIKIGFAQFVESRVQIFYLRTLPDTQRIKLCFLVTAETESVDQLQNTDLFFISVGRSTGRHAIGRQKTLIAGDVLKLLADGGVNDVAALIAIDAREFVEVTPPLFWNCIGVCQVGFKKLFNIGKITTLQVGSLS